MASVARRDLAGKTVVVLGASGAHGSATARMLGREGANLALGGRDREKLEALEEEVRGQGGQALVVGVHLAKRHHSVHLVEAAVAEFGGLDALLFMARASAPPLNSMDLDAWEHSADVNIKGFLYSVAAALPAMLEGGGGHVVCLNIGNPDPPDPLYAASRAATHVLLRELSGEFFDEGIRASEVTLVSRGANPKRCAETVCRLLADPPDLHTGFSIQRVAHPGHDGL